MTQVKYTKNNTKGQCLVKNMPKGSNCLPVPTIIYIVRNLNLTQLILIPSNIQIEMRVSLFLLISILKISYGYYDGSDCYK